MTRASTRSKPFFGPVTGHSAGTASYRARAGARREMPVKDGPMGSPDKRQELELVIASATDKPHLILLWGHPDPDAI